MPDCNEHHLVCRYRGRLDVKPEKQPDGKYAIRNVPIFQCHTREEIGTVDDRWMRACVRDQQEHKQKGFLPRLIVGHNWENTDSPEKPVVGHLDNYRYDEAEKWLYADYVDLREEDLPLLARYPGRSAEANVTTPQIHVVALLGGSPPYFRLPDVHFRQNDKIAYYSVEIPTMSMTPNESSASTAISPEDKAKFAEFCKYMKMYEDEKMKTTTETPAEEKQEEKQEAKFADGELTVKYADLQGKYEQLLQRVDALTNDKVALEDQLETTNWTKKYAETRIPSGRLNIDDEVKFLMDLPKEKRQAYFDKSVKSFQGPSTKPLEKEAGSSAPEPGSQEEADAIKKYCADNKLSFGVGQREWVSKFRGR